MTDIMGIVNVTPDSFSDGGRFTSADAAVEHGLALAEAGASIIDVGGESTRPGSDTVDLAVEKERVVPVVAALRQQLPVTVAISVDTQKAAVAAAAIDAGATWVNDVSGCTADPKMIEVAAEAEVELVVMHMVSTPKTMQKDFAYNDVVSEVFAELLRRTKRVIAGGVSHERVIVDPGIGFGKSTEHNLELLSQIARFHDLGFRVLVGASRKRFLGDITGRVAADRDAASAAVSGWCAQHHVDYVRVHDVASSRDAIAVIKALR